MELSGIHMDPSKIYMNLWLRSQGRYAIHIASTGNYMNPTGGSRGTPRIYMGRSENYRGTLASPGSVSAAYIRSAAN